MNFLGCSRLHFLLVLLQCLNMAMVGVFALCTSASFSRSIGYILRGFLLGEFEVGDIMACKERCIISINCLSLNVLTNPNGGFVCQLNSGLKEDGAPEQFVQQEDRQYYGLKVILYFIKMHRFLVGGAIRDFWSAGVAVTDRNNRQNLWRQNWLNY